jgi:hypothetical protein
VFVWKENGERPMDGVAALPVADEGVFRNKAEEVSEMVERLGTVDGEGGKSASNEESGDED